MTEADPYNLQRFIDAQRDTFAIALAELRAGRKESHWMWFVFPQIAGLGHSPTARFFAISSLDEARSYLEHPLLGVRLGDSLAALMRWADRRGAEEIFGPIDAMKLRSSLTLFDAVSPDDVFRRALQTFGSAPDERTLALLREQR